MLELIEDIHLLQPGTSVHISGKTPDRFLHAACRVIRQGHGYPSVFNPDIYIQEMLRSGKSLEDAREGGCSGCIEVGAFGKEAFVLTGYLNVPKILEITLNNGIDPLTWQESGTGNRRSTRFWQLRGTVRSLPPAAGLSLIDLKIRVSNYIDTMFAKYAPAPFLSLLIDDCIARGRDYYNSGPALQHQLYPVLRPGHGDRQPAGPQETTSSKTPGTAWTPYCRPLRRTLPAKRSCGRPF